jgi:uncharacterized membrane protein
MREKRQLKPPAEKEKEPLRLIGLTDGLFATVLTLLVLDLRIPDAVNPSNGDVHSFLKWLGPHLFSYLLTFVVSGMFWTAHHRDFDLVTGSDRRMSGYNLLFLLFIGLLPFNTAAISLGSLGSISYAFFWALYATNIIFAGIMLTIIWLYAVHHHLVDPKMTGEQSRLITLRQMTIPVVFTASIALEYLFPKYYLGPITLFIIPFVLSWLDRSLTPADARNRSASGWEDFFWRAGSVVPWMIVFGLAIWAMTF